MVLNSSVRSAITAGRLGHLNTINPDGSPHSTEVWIGLDGDDVVIGKLHEDVKLHNIRRDPRVSVSIEAPGSGADLEHYLVVEGTAEVVPGGAPELLARLAKVYLGPDAVFAPLNDAPPGFTIRITPRKVRGVGPWND